MGMVDIVDIALRMGGAFVGAFLGYWICWKATKRNISLYVEREVTKYLWSRKQ